MDDMIAHEPRPAHGDLLARTGNGQAEPVSPMSSHKQTAYQYIMLRDHLLSGAPIDPHIARERYGIPHSSLGTTISKLQRAHGWRLEKTRHYDRHGTRYTSYRVMLDKYAKVEAEPPAATATASASVPPECIAVEKVNVIFGKHGPEILIVGEGEPADKPPYKFSRDHLRYLFVNLKLFGEQAKEA